MPTYYLPHNNLLIKIDFLADGRIVSYFNGDRAVYWDHMTLASAVSRTNAEWRAHLLTEMISQKLLIPSGENLVLNFDCTNYFRSDPKNLPLNTHDEDEYDYLRTWVREYIADKILSIQDLHLALRFETHIAEPIIKSILAELRG